MKMKNIQASGNNNSNVTGKFLPFLLVKILVMNGDLKTRKLNVLFTSSHEEGFCKNKGSVKTCSAM